jgi:hypothetical protein
MWRLEGSIGSASRMSSCTLFFTVFSNRAAFETEIFGKHASQVVAPKNDCGCIYSTYGKMISNNAESLEVRDGSRTAVGLDAVGYDVGIPPSYVGRHGCFSLPVSGAGGI